MSETTTAAPPGVDPTTGEIQNTTNAPADTPGHTAPVEKPAKALTEYVVQYGISDEADDEKPPRMFSIAGPPIEATQPQEAKKRMMAVAPEGLRNAADEGKLWLVAVPVRSFKNLKRVEPEAPRETRYKV